MATRYAIKLRLESIAPSTNIAEHEYISDIVIKVFSIESLNERVIALNKILVADKTIRGTILGFKLASYEVLREKH